MRYYHGIWFCGDGKTQDFLAKMFKEDGKWILVYRFRYYSPDDPGNDPFSGKDDKSGYRVSTPDDSDATKAKMIDAVRQLLPVVELQYDRKADFVLLECADDDPKMLEELSKRSWAHIREDGSSKEVQP